METWQYVCVLATVWVAVIFVMKGRMLIILSFDFACAGILVYLMIMSVIIDENSLEYLGGGF